MQLCSHYRVTGELQEFHQAKYTVLCSVVDAKAGPAAVQVACWHDICGMNDVKKRSPVS